jgi:hypothetical protein
MLDDDCRVTPFLDYDLCVRGKRTCRGRSERDCEDIELYGRLL